MGKNLPQFVASWGTIDAPIWYAGQKGWGNHHKPDVYVQDTNQNYPVGTKFVEGDRTWIYGYVQHDEDAGERAGVGLLNIADELVEASDAVVHAIGETEIVIEDTTSTVNLWAGGYMMCRTHPTIQYRILESTANSGGHITATLDRGLVVAIAASQNIRLNQYQYKKLCTSRSAGRHQSSIMGVAPIISQASKYTWIQTWGPAVIVGGDEVPGSAASLRMCQFNIDGTLVYNGWDGTVSGNGFEMAGYLIPQTSSDGGANYTASWHVFLILNR